MVSFWPFKGGDESAGFEKTLSNLATKIQKANIKNDRLRQNARRYKGMWTLYTCFAYILAALILTLVTGWQSWGPAEYGGMAGGPIIIYAVRKLIVAYYDYRISNTQSYLESLYKERDATIEKLKAATKYNSTQQLLEKYGSSHPKSESPQGPKKKKPQESRTENSPLQGRTNLPPPPTANIPRNRPQSPGQAGHHQLPSTPSHGQPNLDQKPLPPPPPFSPSSPTAEFAPNAFAAAPQYGGEPNWYDRILDVLLGEDETSPKNRIALICDNCRLVNGQAPPGKKTLEEIGRWRCGGCGSWNGKENETKKLVRQIAATAQAPDMPEVAVATADPEPDAVEESASDDAVEDEVEADAENKDLAEDKAVGTAMETPARSTRSRTKGKKK